jgi:hypothetical protein
MTASLHIVKRFSDIRFAVSRKIEGRSVFGTSLSNAIIGCAVWFRGKELQTNILSLPIAVCIREQGSSASTTSEINVSFRFQVKPKYTALRTSQLTHRRPQATELGRGQRAMLSTLKPLASKKRADHYFSHSLSPTFMGAQQSSRLSGGRKAR